MIDDCVDFNVGLIVFVGIFMGGVQSVINQIYGVGKVGMVNIGFYVMFMKVNSVIVDGKFVDLIYQQNGLMIWVKSIDGLSQGENNCNIIVVLVGSIDLFVFQIVIFLLVMFLVIQNIIMFFIIDDIWLDGQLMISLKYL